MADILTAENPAPDTLSNSIQAMAQGNGADGYSRTGDKIKTTMTELVKGAGMATRGGNQPLTDLADITTRATKATVDLRTETWRGYHARADVVAKGFRPDFLSKYGLLANALNTPSPMEAISSLVSMIPGGADAVKSWTAGNLGIGSVS